MVVEVNDVRIAGRGCVCQNNWFGFFTNYWERPAGYAFSTYGEVVACWIQDVALVALISQFAGIDDWGMLWAATAFGLFCWWLTSASCTLATLTSMPLPLCPDESTLPAYVGGVVHQFCLG